MKLKTRSRLFATILFLTISAITCSSRTSPSSGDTQAASTPSPQSSTQQTSTTTSQTAQTGATTGLNRKPVTIDTGCGAPDVTLSLSAKDQVLWQSSGKKFKVLFPKGSPFAETSYDVPAGGAIDPGPVVNKPTQPIDPNNPPKYKYSITGPDCSKDPQVIITD